MNLSISKKVFLVVCREYNAEMSDEAITLIYEDATKENTEIDLNTWLNYEYAEFRGVSEASQKNDVSEDYFTSNYYVRELSNGGILAFDETGKIKR